MDLIKKPINNQQIDNLKAKYGSYAKITADLKKEWLVVGPELHADGESLLVDQGSDNINIWGGGINFNSLEIDTTAVLNIRPNLNNNSMEIIDSEKREKFISLVKEIFDITNG